jgi:hypothetical protein
MFAALIVHVRLILSTKHRGRNAGKSSICEATTATGFICYSHLRNAVTYYRMHCRARGDGRCEQSLIRAPKATRQDCPERAEEFDSHD